MVNYSDMPEEALFKLIAEKDIDAAKYIYDKYSPAIYGLILGKIKFTKAAEQILLDTFVSFIKADFSKSPFQKCIYTTLHVLADSYIKKFSVLYVSHLSQENESPHYPYKFTEARSNFL